MKTEKRCLPTVAKGRVRLACKASAVDNVRLIQVTPSLVECGKCQKVLARIAASMELLVLALRAAGVEAARTQKVVRISIG